MRYGMPYCGSKNKIVDDLINVLPAGRRFVDLFGGGGAMTHGAFLSGKYKEVHYNEINPVVYDGFRKALGGGFSNEKRWVDKETFHREKKADPYVALCFSFGNEMMTYFCSGYYEPWKKALHFSRVFGDNSLFRDFGIDTDGSADDIKKNQGEYKKKYIDWYFREVVKKPIEEIEEDIKKIPQEKEKLRRYLVHHRDINKLKGVDIDRHLGTNGMAGHYFGKSQWVFPTAEAYKKMREIMPTLEPWGEIYGHLQSLESLESLQRLESLQGLESLQSLQSLQGLESLQSLQRLQKLERLQGNVKLSFSNSDYRDVELRAGDVVYCDIPYKGTGKYKDNGFDYNSFYEWARGRGFYVSEYNAPFVEVWSKNVLSRINDKRPTMATEKLYVS